MATTTTGSKHGPEAEHVSAAVTSPETLEHDVHHPDAWFSWRLFSSMLIIGLSLGLYGYDNNFAAPLMQLPLFIEKYQGPGLTFTARNLNLLIPVPIVGAAIGTFIAAPAMKMFGRKKTFLASYVLLCVPGSFLQLFAPNIGAMVAGRFWNYVGISILTTTAPLYLTELVPAHVRGRAIGACVAGVAATGVLSTTIVWATLNYTDSRQYQVPLAIQAALPVLLAGLTLLIPESPMWYTMKGRHEDARRVLLSLRRNNPNIVDAEMQILQKALDLDSAKAKVHFWSIIDRDNLKRTMTAGALLSAGQVGGQILVGSFATIILVQSGVSDPFRITIIITCTQFIGTLVGPVLVDKIGRRPVALVGFSILLVLNLAAGSLAAVGLATESQRLGLAAVFILFGFFNAASFQSLGFVLPTEIARPALREPTMSWTTFWSYATAVITTFAVPQIMNPDAAGLGAKTAFIFAGCIVITLIWAYFFIPETAGRTIAEIEEMYSIGLPVWKWRGYKCSVVTETGGHEKDGKNVEVV